MTRLLSCAAVVGLLACVTTPAPAPAPVAAARPTPVPPPPSARVVFLSRPDPSATFTEGEQRALVELVRSDLVALGQMNGYVLATEEELAAAESAVIWPITKKSAVNVAARVPNTRAVVTARVWQPEPGYHVLELALFSPMEESADFTGFGGEGTTAEQVRADYVERAAPRLARSRILSGSTQEEAPAMTPPTPLAAVLQSAEVGGNAKALLKAAFTSARGFQQESEEGTLSTSIARISYDPDRGNRYAVFFDTKGSVHPRDTAEASPFDEDDTAIGIDRVQFPWAVSPASVAATKCLITDGPVGVRTVGSEPGFVFLAAANIDDDPEFDCWSIASFTRYDAGGLPIYGGEPHHEQADVSPEAFAAAEKSWARVTRLSEALLVATASGGRMPESLEALAAEGSRRKWVLDTDIPECRGLNYAQLGPNEGRLTCPAFGFDLHLHAAPFSTGLALRERSTVEVLTTEDVAFKGRLLQKPAAP